MTRIKGLETLFSANQKDFKSKEDCIIAALHCILINSDLLCVGTEDEFSDADLDSATELLPEKWNENQEVYSLRYRGGKDLSDCYLLKMVKAGSNLHINFVLNQEKSSEMTLNSNDFVSDDITTKFTETYKNIELLSDSFTREILKKTLVKDKSSISPSKKSSKKKSGKTDPIEAIIPIPEVRPIPKAVPNPRNQGPSPLMYPQIGGADLDPFGRSEGSMLFDPSSLARPSPYPLGSGGFGPLRGGRMGLPPHAVPHGARFDPFAPPGIGRFNPNPDHFRPPDYDDMYM